jgi:hypothetical protein
MQCWDDFQRIQGLAAGEYALKILPPKGVFIEPGFMVDLLADEEGMMLDNVVNLPLPRLIYPNIGSGINRLNEGVHLSDQGSQPEGLFCQEFPGEAGTT